MATVTYFQPVTQHNHVYSSAITHKMGKIDNDNDNNIITAFEKQKHFMLSKNDRQKLITLDQA